MRSRSVSSCSSGSFIQPFGDRHLEVEVVFRRSCEARDIPHLFQRLRRNVGVDSRLKEFPSSRMLLMVSLTSNPHPAVRYAGYKLHGADRSPHHHIPAVALRISKLRLSTLRCALAVAFVCPTGAQSLRPASSPVTHHTGDTSGEIRISASSIDR